MLLDQHDITSPEFWARQDAHALVDEIRREGTVQRHETPDDGPVWSVLAHREALAVLGDPVAFSSQRGSLLGSGRRPPAGAGKMMALTDPPRHRAYRESVAPFFSTSGAAALEQHVVHLTRRVLRELPEGEDIDFVHEIGAVVPLLVMCELMGVPAEDRDDVVAMCDEAFLGDTALRRQKAHQKLLPYLFSLVTRKRREPGRDVASALAGDLDVEEAVLNCDNIIVGGVQTVRHTAAMAMLALTQHPDAWQTLRAGADMGVAVEELLRWTSVGLQVLRSATRDVELAGCHIRAGDAVVVWTPAANRDPAVFQRPHHLDLRRSPNRHVAFGWGAHYCIGAPLARIELRALFTALATTLESVEVVRSPVHNRSIINFGLDRFTVRLRRKVRG
ncbi:cytochrome P450 [Saccharothrix coeruleofusca]|uniref:Cytochrome P450 n=1 Tax=Saccharothrix coeruleofusca TaxID=33919 RepID=A0A918ALT8_9PSEU|nr:cytochrome P450 [Saccharothrix coeruleofusca]GGP55800.1 cytochrome P450 [Saccharothrix coeruleofusca]